ncbi:hypothetical protein Btru_071767 [Bulinus truncatus]|nr:hypothetical protein Btru_071767 [Bulinus truncatus]
MNSSAWTDKFITYGHDKNKSNDSHHTPTCTIKPNVTSYPSFSKIVVCMLPPHANKDPPNLNFCLNSTIFRNTNMGLDVQQPQDYDVNSERKENTYDYADEVETHIKSPDFLYKSTISTDEGIYGNSRELNSYTDTGTLKYFILEKV